MSMKATLGGSVLLTVIALMGSTAPAQAYGPEGLFGGRPQPDSSITLSNPVDLRNDRPERAESVLEHPRADYDPLPYALGSFEIFPTMELGPTYDTNIYAETTGRRDDVIGTIRPIVNVFSNWSRHALSLTTFGDINHYSQHASENYNNAVVDLNGRYDIMNQTWVAARAGYQRLSEYRSSPDAVNGSEPVTLGFGKAGLTAYRGVGKLKANVDYDYRRFDYDDTPTAGGGFIDQSDRNRNEHVFGGKLSYELSGNVKPYVKAGYNVRKYDDNLTHDSDGFDTVLGMEADFGGITSVDVFAGWMEQYYDDFAFKKKLSAPRMGARVDWNVTGMTSVVFEANRTIEETTLTNYNSYYQTGGSVTVTHELRRNILLEANTTFSHDDFNGNGDRQDDLLSFGLGGRYLINRSLYTDVLYNWERRYSTDNPSNYVRNQATIRLGVRF